MVAFARDIPFVRQAFCFTPLPSSRPSGCGCPARIRTSVNGAKVHCAATTPPGSVSAASSSPPSWPFPLRGGRDLSDRRLGAALEDWPGVHYTLWHLRGHAGRPQGDFTPILTFPLRGGRDIWAKGKGHIGRNLSDKPNITPILTFPHQGGRDNWARGKGHLDRGKAMEGNNAFFDVIVVGAGMRRCARRCRQGSRGRAWWFWRRPRRRRRGATARSRAEGSGSCTTGSRTFARCCRT